MANKNSKSASVRNSSVPGIPASVMNHIGFLADRMIGRCNLHDSDRDDIVQEMTIAVLRTIEDFRKTQAAPLAVRYLNKVADNAATEIYRYRIQRGLDTPTQPLETCVDTSSEPIGDDAEANIRRRDVRDIVSKMPEDMRIICEMLMDGSSLTEIAAALHVSLSTIRMRRIPKIRRFFTANGIKSEFF